MTIEDFRNRLLEMLCEAANDCSNPADTLNALMDNIKSLLADIETE